MFSSATFGSAESDAHTAEEVGSGRSLQRKKTTPRKKIRSEHHQQRRHHAAKATFGALRRLFPGRNKIFLCSLVTISA